MKTNLSLEQNLIHKKHRKMQKRKSVLIFKWNYKYNWFTSEMEIFLKLTINFALSHIDALSYLLNTKHELLRSWIQISHVKVLSLKKV